MSKSEFPKFYNTKKRHFLDVWKLINFQAMSRILYLLGYVSSYLWNKRVGLKICKIQFNFKVYDSYIYVYVFIYLSFTMKSFALNGLWTWRAVDALKQNQEKRFLTLERKVEWGNKSDF